jgi:hypothetical protein
MLHFGGVINLLIYGCVVGVGVGDGIGDGEFVGVGEEKSQGLFTPILTEESLVFPLSLVA